MSSKSRLTERTGIGNQAVMYKASKICILFIALYAAMNHHGFNFINTKG